MDSLDPPAEAESNWKRRYHEKHRWIRLEVFPPGITPPRKVRIYRRDEAYILNWWDPGSKKSQSERIVGDLLAALVRARQIDDQILAVRTAGVVSVRRLGHNDLIDRYVRDLGRRADAGEIDPNTVERYRTALRHYAKFVEQPSIARSYPNAGTADREFRLAFDGFLGTSRVTANGRPAGCRRPMRDPGFVRDTVRAMYCWAADSDRGGLLPGGFRNPFLRTHRDRSVLGGDPLAEPDITKAMAVELIAACDLYQLRLFVPLLFFGLRAAEPCHLFAEHLSDEWLQVPCIPDLGLLTKGRRDKRFPLLEELKPFWSLFRDGRAVGLLHERRGVFMGQENAPFHRASLNDMIAEYRRRCEAAKYPTASERARIREFVHRDAGGIVYDDVQDEFMTIAKRLHWPPSATLKDLRHAFATAMNNAGMPDPYRRYLMGHAPARAALNSYTHLNNLSEQYGCAVRREWGSLVAMVKARVVEFDGIASLPDQERRGGDS